MRIVYEPRGRAKEYAELACNLYIGCTHGCKYCFAPGCMHCTQADWARKVYVRKKALELFSRDAAEMGAAGETRAVLFSFLSDPYQPLEEEEGVTHRALEIVRDNGLKSKILTKGAASRVSADLGLMYKAGTELGVTISFVNDTTRKRWEPEAASVEERLCLLEKAHKMGVKTWVSLEPVIDPKQALAVIRTAMPYVDFWKVGKLNHMKTVEDKIDWVKFRRDVVALFQQHGKCESTDYYLKQDLRAAT